MDSSGSGYGGGLGTLNAAVSLIRVDFVQNSTAPWQTYGGALSLSGGQAWIADCLFSSNKTLSGGVNRGGALYASTVAPLHIENSRFLDNAISGGAYAGGGGALKLEGVEAGMVTGCTFQGNYSLPRKGVALNRGSVIHTSGSGTLAIRDCAIRASPTLGLSSEELYLEPTAALSAVNTELQGGLSGDGIVKEGAGSLALSNCLVYAHPSNGVRVAAGTVSLVNCTIASNGYWGVTNGAGTVAALNCIAWTNGLGGFTANCDLTYTCAQETHAGAGNRPDDPLFAGPATNNFRLTRSSPCVNAGWNGDWTKADRDLDGLPRLNAAAVDLGAYECQLPSGGTLVVVR